MKKIIVNLILFVIFSLILSLIILSTIGIETNKFNKFISKKISQSKNINLELSTIKFKLDPKQLSLFLETEKPNINYRELQIPVQNIKAYVDFISLIKVNPEIKKITIVLEELDIKELNRLSKIVKPSNFKSLLNNKVKSGKLISEIEFFLNKEGLLKNFIAKGKVKDLNIELLKNTLLTKTKFSFFADNSDILIKNIFGNIDNVKILDGDLKINLDNELKLNSNFKTYLNLDQKFFTKHKKYLGENKNFEKVKNLKGEFNNSFFINFDNTYKIKDYNYNISGNLEKSKLELIEAIKNNFIIDEIKEIFLSNLKIRINGAPKKIEISGIGDYSFNNFDFFKIDFINKSENDQINLKLNFDYSNNLIIDLINYQKAKKTVGNVNINLEKFNNKILIKQFNFNEEKNSIKLKGLKFDNYKFLSFKEIIVKTKNNDFSIKKDKKIFIKGNQFDATNLVKFLSNQSGKNKFKELNSEIEIDFKNIKVPLSEELQNFKLLGEIKKGNFVKILSKGDFGGNNFLDITMKKAKNNEKKYLEIYSDLTRPLLTEYDFFNGLSGGKLFFTSIIGDTSSNSKLKIENFKVVNAPGVIKLLSLADLGGLADLAEGEGLSFDILEIEMEKNKELLKINEILALGPSMSVLMEGYQDKDGLTSLRGTLVPAKTLNKIISKIPVIGNIVIPKEIGEGLFGISFKMKGPKGKIKTTINPIRTLTPRFIQKMIDKNKKTK